MAKTDNFKKADLTKDAFELFDEVKKDIDEIKKRIENKRLKFEETNKNGAIRTSHRFTL